jgi:hypothetical protein
MARIKLVFRVVEKSTTERAIRTAPSAHRTKSRSIVGGLTFLATTIILSMLATSGSYALWNGKTVVNGSTISTGDTSLTINGGTSAALALPATALSPGTSVFVAATFANVGTTPLVATATSVSILSDSNSLANYLSLTVTRVASAGACAAGLSGGTSAALASFNTSASPYNVPAGVSFLVCFELKLDSTAPVSVAGGATTFRMNVSVVQSRT